MSQISVKTLAVGMFQSNCHILTCQHSGASVLVDPGAESERILDAVNPASVVAIVLTHAHIDHVGAVKAVKDATGAPIHLHQADLPLYQGVPLQAQMFGISSMPMADVDVLFTEPHTISCGQFHIEALHTPGHSPGGCCYLVRDHEPAPLLFSGDTLFCGSIGRTDLMGGDYQQLIQAIRSRLFSLPETTRVFPGHGEASTVSREKKSNPFFI